MLFGTTQNPRSNEHDTASLPLKEQKQRVRNGNFSQPSYKPKIKSEHTSLYSVDGVLGSAEASPHDAVHSVEQVQALYFQALFKPGKRPVKDSLKKIN